MRRLVNILQFGLHCWWLCPLWLLLWSMDKDWDSSTSEDWLSPPAYFFSFSLVKRRLDAPSRTPSGFLTGYLRGSLLTVFIGTTRPVVVTIVDQFFGPIALRFHQAHRGDRCGQPGQDGAGQGSCELGKTGELQVCRLLPDWVLRKGRQGMYEELTKVHKKN